MSRIATPLPAGFLRDPIHWLALGFGAGLAPRMPGTFGTLVGVLIYIPCRNWPSVWFASLVAVVCVAGVGICGRAAGRLGVHDHPAIVWDEVAGFLAAMIFAPRGWTWIAVAFLLFRAFDIFKPWPIALLDRRVRGGWGIMLDDVAAAAYTAISMRIIAYLLAR